jgi:cell fate regulator YaaT (PSP1 superfamily)
VVVETVRGIELGVVRWAPKPFSSIQNGLEIKPILRRATADDERAYERYRDLAIQALMTSREAVRRMKLEMQLLRADYTLDGSKVMIAYTAEQRVDFRELVKDLASKLKCRIDLRQIGTRDRAKIVGGIGVCGLPLCCNTFLGEFDGISINMAKNQFLALNIQKLSGHCGKLICCLKYENDDYSELRRGLPKIGYRLKYNNDFFKITSVNVLTRQVRLENHGVMEMVKLDEVMRLYGEQLAEQMKKEGGSHA